MKISIILKLLPILLLNSLYADTGTLTRIIDGDTIKFGATTCRLANIDTPEKARNSRLEKVLDNCNGITMERMIDAGTISSKFINEILVVGNQYNYDVVTKDKYERSVCNVWIDRKTTVNQLMVRNGYAVPFFSFIKDDDLALYKKELAYAKRTNSGLFKSYKPIMDCMIKNLSTH